MHLVSGKVEFNACQVSLLWHNSCNSQPIIFFFSAHPRRNLYLDITWKIATWSSPIWSLFPISSNSKPGLMVVRAGLGFRNKDIIGVLDYGYPLGPYRV